MMRVVTVKEMKVQKIDQHKDGGVKQVHYLGKLKNQISLYLRDKRRGYV